MKYVKYIAAVAITLLLVSFLPGKKSKDKPTCVAPFGHVQYVKQVRYNAIQDSSDAILKGSVISDADTHPPFHRGGPLIADRIVHHPAPIVKWVYDENGKELECAQWHTNGESASKETNVYYENGDVREATDSTFAYDDMPLNVRTQQYTYKYDASGKNKLVSNYWDYSILNKDNPPIFTRTVNIYDQQGKEIESRSFSADTINPFSVIYKTYNEKGKLVETDERKREGNILQLAPFEKNDFWYDGKGRLYDKATYKPNQGLARDEKITFDTTGKTITIYLYGRNRELIGTVVKTYFKATHTWQEDTYDDRRQLTDYTISHVDSAGHLIDKGVFHINYPDPGVPPVRTNTDNKSSDTVMVNHIVNDNHNNLVVEEKFSPDGKVISQKSFQYTYDEIGNWISQVEFNGDKPVEITEREIVYFKE